MCKKHCIKKYLQFCKKQPLFFYFLRHSQSTQKTRTKQKVFTRRLLTIPRRNKKGENQWNLAKCRDDSKKSRIDAKTQNYTYYVNDRKVRD